MRALRGVSVPDCRRSLTPGESGVKEATEKAEGV